MIRHIVFDIGKVLIHYDPDLAFAHLIPDAGERKWFFDNVCTFDWNIEQDRGRTWEEAEALLIAAHPSHTENIRNFRRNWRMMVPHAYDDTVAIMLGLIERGEDVTMLTNFAADTFVEAREMFPFLNVPRGVTVSGEVGMLKPERGIYELHARSFGLNPADTLFIDDSAKNVEGAKAAGWHAVLFTGAATLARDLQGLGVGAAAFPPLRGGWPDEVRPGGVSAELQLFLNYGWTRLTSGSKRGRSHPTRRASRATLPSRGRESLRPQAPARSMPTRAIRRSSSIWVSPPLRS